MKVAMIPKRKYMYNHLNIFHISEEKYQRSELVTEICGYHSLGNLI